MAKFEVTRFELIDRSGRVIVHYAEGLNVVYDTQDDGRTFKLFVDATLNDEMARLREHNAALRARCDERGKTIKRLEEQLRFFNGRYFTRLYRKVFVMHELFKRGGGKGPAQ